MKPSITTLTEGRELLRSIRNQRLAAMKRGRSYIDADFARKELAIIGNALATINTSEKMKSFLERKQEVLRVLMPGKNEKGINTLNKILS